MLFPCLALPADAGLQEKIDAAVRSIRQNPLDFSAWLEYRTQSGIKGVPEKKIARYEPILIAVCDKSTGTMILLAAVMPGKDSRLYDVNAPGNNTPQKLGEIAGYARMLEWYTPEGKKIRFEYPKIITGKFADGPVSRVCLGKCGSEIISTCRFIPVSDVDELSMDWRKYYQRAKKKTPGLSRLNWQFISKNKLVWGIGYDITEQNMNGEILREAHLELVSGSTTGSCRVRL